ncbi:hypothetical protein V6Z11_A06G161000 [Gossypium hirsutum]
MALVIGKRQTAQQISANRLCLKASIDVAGWLSFQGCAFRGRDESSRSKNCGNFFELLSLLASYDEKVEDVLKSAPQNASFHVKDIASLTLKNVIFNVLLQHSFDIQNIQGQGFDGARNMRGVFNSFQALILNDCRYAYYKAQATNITHLVSINELATGFGMNQIGTLQRPGETRWSSHLNPVTSLLKMYNATSTVLENLKNTASSYSQRGDAHNTYNRLRSFEFIFIFHMMKEVLGIIDNLFQALQRCSQDILNGMSLVLTTKDLIQNHNKKEDVIVEHHYRVDIFFAIIDTQLQELKSRFNENVVELLTLTTALDPKEFFKLFDIDKICILHPDLRKISTLSELCRSLVESGKSVMYPFIDRLILLILTLPVSTASSERAFSVMKIMKTRLCSKMDDGFLISSLVVYVEKEIAKKFDINEIIDDFSELKDRRV